MDWSAEKLLDRLEAHGECQRIEAKASRSQLGSSALETISAFSNEPDMSGGYFVLGLKECPDETNRYVAQGVSLPDQLQQAIVGVCRENFNICIIPQITLHRVDDKTLIIAYIPEAPARSKPIYIKAKGLEEGSLPHWPI